jgi:hypothetical protein
MAANVSAPQPANALQSRAFVQWRLSHRKCESAGQFLRKEYFARSRRHFWAFHLTEIRVAAPSEGGGYQAAAPGALARA